MKKYTPIGIFDSGIGGLTVARAIKKLMPHHPIVYFGDTAHLPYGEKSTAALQAYAIKSVDFLMKKGCAHILIACNSASVAAYDLIQEYTASRATAFSVIDPVVNYLAQHYENQTVGLIGTRQTVNSKVYEKKVLARHKNIQLRSLATPLLASMIEEGFFNNSISKNIVAEYLSRPELHHIAALVLACTHYPLIRQDILNFFDNKIDVIDGSMIVAQEVYAFMKAENSIQQEGLCEDEFYVSDLTESFAATTKIFFSENVELHLHKLWE